MMALVKVFIQVLEPYAQVIFGNNQVATADKQQDVHACFSDHLVDLSATTAEAEWNTQAPMNFS